MNESTAIQISGITRKFRHTTAIKSVDLEISNGELFGLVGPDGAGKTTLLRLLSGLLHISSGEGQVLGFDLRKESEKIKSRIGYMAQNFSLYSELTVLENLLFFSDLFDVRRSELTERMEVLLHFAGLNDFRSRPAGKLSGGMQKKLALACTLIHQPRLLLLDEPTTGVDPVSRREFWDILSDLHLQDTTILVSTPYMDEADRCSRVGMIYDGKLVRCASPAEIRQSMETELIEVNLSEWQKGKTLLKKVDGIHAIETYGETLRLQVDDANRYLPIVKKALHEAGLPYTSLRQTRVRMEDAFIALIREMEE